MPRKKTQKQREFDMVLKYTGNKKEFTKNLKLTDIEILRNNKDKIDWEVLANRRLTNEIIEEFWEDLKKYLNIEKHYYNMNFEILKVCRDVFNWYGFNLHQVNPLRFTLEFYKEFEKELEPHIQYSNKILNLPKETIEYLLDKRNEEVIRSVSECGSISLKYIEEYKDILDWNLLSFKSVELCNEKNFKKYEDRINISRFAALKTFTNMYVPSSSFIIKKLNIVLNEEFLLKYKNDLDWDQVINWYGYIAIGMLNKDLYKDKFNIVSNDFFKKHQDELPESAIVAIRKFDPDISINKYYKVDPKYIWVF